MPWFRVEMDLFVEGATTEEASRTGQMVCMAATHIVREEMLPNVLMMVADDSRGVDVEEQALIDELIALSKGKKPQRKVV